MISFSYVLNNIARFMLRHNQLFRMRWDLFVMLLAIYNCIMIPFTVAFQPNTGKSFNVWERFVDVCFGLDIIFNFRTSFVNSKTGFEIFSQKKIVRNYITSGRFFMDLGASIPIDTIIEAFDKKSSSKQLKLIGLLKLVRLLRLGRIVRYMKFKQGFKLGMRLM